MAERLLELLNEAKDLIGKQPPTGQFDAYPRYLKATDIMEIMQVSKTKAHKMMKEHDFPLIKVGKSVRVEREQFFQWIMKHSNKVS